MRRPFKGRVAQTKHGRLNGATTLRRAAMVLAIVSFASQAVWGQQAAPVDDGKAHFELMPYLVLAGMGGDLTLKGQTASFSQSTGDILSNLQFGVMDRTRVKYKKLFAGLDGVYMGLGAANDAVDAGVDQVIIEPSVGYRVAPFLEVLGGARYNSLSTDLKFRAPLGAASVRSKDVVGPVLREPSDHPARPKIQGVRAPGYRRF